MELDLWVDEHGGVQMIYDDRLTPEFAEFNPATRRASHVEPFGCGWIADMRPVGGPVLFDEATSNPLGRAAFRTRAEALAAERAWLDARLRDGRVEAQP